MAFTPSPASPGGGPSAAPGSNPSQSTQAAAGKPAAAPSPGGAPPAAAAEPAPAPDPAPSARVQALMKREADAVRRMKEAKTAQEALKAKEEAVAAREAKIAAWEDQWKSDPLKAIEERGLDPVQLAMAKAGGAGVTPEMQIGLLRQEIQAMRKEQAEERRKAQEDSVAKVSAEEAEQTEAFKGEIASHVSASAEKYPLTHADQRGADLVFATIEDHYQKTLKETGDGEVMEIGRASELTEERLMAAFARSQELLAKRAGTSSAVKEAAPPPGAVRRLEVPQSERWVERPVKTLADIEAPTSTSPPGRYLSESERNERALAKLREIRAARQR